MPEPPPADVPVGRFSPRQRAALGALLAATALVKAALAVTWRGYLTGDDLEIVETAAKYAAGVVYHPWELRCLFHPIVLVWPVMKPAVLLSVRDPGALDLLAAVPTLFFSTLAIVLVARLALAWGSPPSTALAAAFLYSAAWLPLTFGATPFPRPISTALLLGAFLLAASDRRPVAACAFAGALAGAAFAVRWSEGVVLLPLVGWTLWRYRDVRRIAAILAGFAAGAAVCAGLVDFLTWGRPFASLFAFVRIMWLEIPASRLAAEERFPWYFATVLRWAGPILLLLLIPAWRERRGRVALALAASIVVLMSCFAHKEWRYLQIAVPFIALAAAVGWQRLRAAGHRRLAAAALLLCVPYGLERTVTIFRDKGLGGLEAARYIAAMRPRPRVLAFEQMWAYGEHLWLGNDVEIREMEYARPLLPHAIRTAAAGADVAGVYALHLNPAALRELSRLGFRPLVSFQRGTSYECSLFARGAFAPRRDDARARSSDDLRGPSVPSPPPPTRGPARAPSR